MATSTIKGKHFGPFMHKSNFSFPWTAPSDGIAVLKLQKNDSAGQVTYYVRCTDLGVVCYISTNLSARFQITSAFPVRGGMRYTEDYSSGGLANMELTFYPLI